MENDKDLKQYVKVERDCYVNEMEVIHFKRNNDIYKELND